MKKLILLLAIVATSCATHTETITAKVTDYHLDKWRKSKSYIVLETNDTIFRVSKDRTFEIGKEYEVTYMNGFNKILK